MDTKIKILWADDEIDMLKAHIIFLEQKGYEVDTSNNGDEALDLIKANNYNIVFLDENMPGLSGLETLQLIKNLHPRMPVVMITKSEEETIMEEAIGSNISDYLIKPVKPQQLLLSLKKNLETKELVSQKTSFTYQQEFRNLGMEISNNLTVNEWKIIYKRLVDWEIKLNQSGDESMIQILNMQKEEANVVFSRFIERNYTNWIWNRATEKPLMSHTLLREKLFPMLQKPEPIVVIVIDNLRYDQWKTIQPLIEEYYKVDDDDLYYSILPTVTQFARNSLFSGLMPLEIEKKYPQYWTQEWDEGTKNQFEGELFSEMLKRHGKEVRHSFTKVLNLTVGRKLAENLSNLMDNKLNVIVYNFVDMLSHARTEMEIIRELADDEPAYRSLTRSWFEHSPLLDIIRYLASKKTSILLTTDHGSIRVQTAVKVVGDKQTNTNLRFKTGRNLNYNKKEVLAFRDPEEILLPRQNISSSIIFTRNNDFFAYPNNFNYYANYYRNTFQHGGISLEEVLIPAVTLIAK